jgi:predicted heme/steroid binding protein
MKTMTEEELRKHDGSNGSAYVACAGKVYDVSRSYHWRRGVHHFRHSAGRDLTDALSQAPHSDELLFKFPVVAVLVATEESSSR